MSDEDQAPGDGFGGYDVIDWDQFNKDYKNGEHEVNGVPQMGADNYSRKMLELRSHVDSEDWDMSKDAYRWKPELEFRRP